MIAPSWSDRFLPRDDVEPDSNPHPGIRGKPHEISISQSRIRSACADGDGRADTSTSKADPIALGVSRDATTYQNDPNNGNEAGFTMFAGGTAWAPHAAPCLTSTSPAACRRGPKSVQLTLALPGVGGLKSMIGSPPAMHGGIAVRAGRVTDRQEFTTMP
jgi:hypothetical protein